MAYGASTYKGMSLFTLAGERKYLSATEREQFLASLTVLELPAERTFCEMLYWTGCRPSEALALAAINIDVDDGMVTIRSLKKRGESKGKHFRRIPLPREFIARLDATHRIRVAHATLDGGRDTRLWVFSRTKGWRLTRSVMQAAEISGIRACAKGLRHAYGVHAALSEVPETRIMKWLGHASLATTAIYLDMAAQEDRLIAQRMWGSRETAVTA